MFSQEQRDEMLDLAISAIRTPGARTKLPAYLREPGCAFVTLRRDGELLGCIGALEPYQELGRDIADHAYAAAFEDPRFPPLQDLHGVHLEVSVLGPLVEFPAHSYSDVVARLPRIGAVVTASGRRGTFLPAVWEQLPTSELFVEGLWRKAGLTRGYWPARVWTYEVEEFGRTVS
jgi:AmmeMemoRadiSam system protein A